MFCVFTREKDTFFKRGAEGGPRLPGLPPFSMPDLDFRHGNLPKKQRILTRLPSRLKKLARTRSCARQSRTLGLSSGWHYRYVPGQFSKVSPKLSKLARTQSYTSTPQNSRGTTTGSTPRILFCGDTLVGRVGRGYQAQQVPVVRT